MSGTKDLADFQAAAGDTSVNTCYTFFLTPPLSTALLENIIVAQPLKNILRFYEIELFIIMKSTVFWDVKLVVMSPVCSWLLAWLTRQS
jgi:hypothetical protein